MSTVYASDLLGQTSTSNKSSKNYMALGSGVLFVSICGVALGMAVSYFRHTPLIPSILVGGITGGIISKVLI